MNSPALICFAINARSSKKSVKTQHADVVSTWMGWLIVWFSAHDQESNPDKRTQNTICGKFARLLDLN